MGYDTEYLGHLNVTPPLNPAEVEWLSGFADWGALPDGDPFRLPMNPRAELAQAFADRGGALSQPRTVPTGIQDWRVCTHGDRISWQRREKSNDATAVLRFLVEHYLGPEATAKGCGRDEFAQFTFDHSLDGIIAASRNDTEELFLITVTDSVIDTVTLVPGVPWR